MLKLAKTEYQKLFEENKKLQEKIEIIEKNDKEKVQNKFYKYVEEADSEYDEQPAEEEYVQPVENHQETATKKIKQKVIKRVLIVLRKEIEDPNKKIRKIFKYFNEE